MRGMQSRMPGASQEAPRSEPGRPPDGRQPPPAEAAERMLRALRRAGLPLNRRAPAGTLPGLESRGCTLGLTTDRSGGGAVRSRATRRKPRLAQVLCEACCRACPGFKFTSIQVSLNTKYRMHHDGCDSGPSRMVTLGNFSRGRMWLHDSSLSSWTAVDPHNRWVAFDGREYHLTEDWDGPERFSLVYFTNPGWCSRSMAPDLKPRLEQLGFPWPEPGDIFKAPFLSKQPRRMALESFNRHMSALPP